MAEKIHIDAVKLKAAIEKSVTTIKSLIVKTEEIAAICDAVVETLVSGHKLLTAGNGGSAAEALHMAEELVGRFRADRKSLPAVSLVADSTALTCIGNDYGFDYIFSRQVEGLGAPGDMLVLFSTSGKAKNLTRALRSAVEAKMRVVCLLGRDGGCLRGRGDFELIVDGDATERIQEAHQVIVHLILDAVESAFSVKQEQR